MMLIWLVGCGHAPPVPTDSYYGFAEPVAPASTPRLADKVIRVAPFSSDAVHRDRAITFADDDQGLRLRHYHYHFWRDSPPRLLQQQVADYLRAHQFGRLVVTDMDVPADITLYGRIKQLERTPSSSGFSSRVGLQMRVDIRDQKEPAHIGQYQAVAVNEGEDVASAVRAFDSAIDAVLHRFAEDLARVGTERVVGKK